MKVGEAMYKAAAEGGAQGTGTGGDGAPGGQGGTGADGSQSNEEKVVDADFEEVDERKGKSA